MQLRLIDWPDDDFVDRNIAGGRHDIGNRFRNIFGIE
jgi:hypothetical protein